MSFVSSLTHVVSKQRTADDRHPSICSSLVGRSASIASCARTTRTRRRATHATHDDARTTRRMHDQAIIIIQSSSSGERARLAQNPHCLHLSYACARACVRVCTCMLATRRRDAQMLPHTLQRHTHLAQIYGQAARLRPRVNLFLCPFQQRIFACLTACRSPPTYYSPAVATVR